MATYRAEKNLRIHYLDPSPENPAPVLLLHGLGSDGSSWGFQIPALSSAGFRPLAPDARGFGKSSYPTERHNLRTLAADQLGLLNHLGCSPIDIVGISLGGITALQLALDHPEVVRRLVLINAAARLFPDDLKTTLYYGLRLLMVLTVGIEKQANLVADRLFPAPGQDDLRKRLIEQITAANPQAYRRTMLALAAFDVRPRLNKLNVPTLVLTGLNDTTIPPKKQTQLASGIPGARHVEIPEAGHAVTVEHPDVVNALVLEFLESDPAPAAQY